MLFSRQAEVRIPTVYTLPILATTQTFGPSLADLCSSNTRNCHAKQPTIDILRQDSSYIRRSFQPARQTLHLHQKMRSFLAILEQLCVLVGTLNPSCVTIYAGGEIYYE